MRKETWPDRWWKFFAVAAMLWLVGTVALYFDDPSVVSAASITDVFLSSFFLVALLGYAFQRRFLARKLWKLTVPAAPIWDIVYPAFLLPERPSDVSPSIVTFVAALLIGMAIVKYVALFRYAYRSDDLWTAGVTDGACHRFAR